MKVTIGIEKVLATLVIAMLFAAYLHHSYVSANLMGRDAFLNKQAYRFDRYMTHPQWAAHIIGSIIVLGILFIVYELLTALFVKLLPNH